MEYEANPRQAVPERMLAGGAEDGAQRRKAVLCSDRPILRAGMARLMLEWLPAEVREAGSRHELIHLLLEEQPALAVVDLASGFDLPLLKEMQDSARGCHFVLLATQLTPELLYHITESGCCSVVWEAAALDLFRTTLLAAADGQVRIDSSVLPEGYTEERIPLSPREAELVALLAQGMKNREIAEALNLSVGTVKVYLSHLFNKLHVKDRFELALYALRNMSTLGAGLKPAGQRNEGEGGEGNAVILDWHAPAGGRMRTPAGRRRMAT